MAFCFKLSTFEGTSGSFSSTTLYTAHTPAACLPACMTSSPHPSLHYNGLPGHALQFCPCCVLILIWTEQEAGFAGLPGHGLAFCPTTVPIIPTYHTGNIHATGCLLLPSSDSGRIPLHCHALYLEGAVWNKVCLHTTPFIYIPGLGLRFFYQFSLAASLSLFLPCIPKSCGGGPGCWQWTALLFHE